MQHCVQGRNVLHAENLMNDIFCFVLLLLYMLLEGLMVQYEIQAAEISFENVIMSAIIFFIVFQTRLVKNNLGH